LKNAVIFSIYTENKTAYKQIDRYDWKKGLVCGMGKIKHKTKLIKKN
jgi:hypothetical protein